MTNHGKAIIVVLFALASVLSGCGVDTNQDTIAVVEGNQVVGGSEERTGSTSSSIEDEYVDGPADFAVYQTIAEMAKESVLVVEGSVVAIEPGPVYDYGDVEGEDASIGLQIARVKVEGVLSGRLEGDTVLILETSTVGGRKARVNGQDPLAIGDRGVFFLTESRNGHVLTSPQGRVLVTASGLRSEAPDTDLGRALEGMDLNAIKQEVAAASIP